MKMWRIFGFPLKAWSTWQCGPSFHSNMYYSNGLPQIVFDIRFHVHANLSAQSYFVKVHQGFHKIDMFCQGIEAYNFNIIDGFKIILNHSVLDVDILWQVIQPDVTQIGSILVILIWFFKVMASFQIESWRLWNLRYIFKKLVANSFIFSDPNIEYHLICDGSCAFWLFDMTWFVALQGGNLFLNIILLLLRTWIYLSTVELPQNPQLQP